jgi:hypothetical protein
MSNAQNLAYSAVQVLHNFGAVATVGVFLAAAVNTSADMPRENSPGSRLPDGEHEP